MKVFLDEGVPERLGWNLRGHEMESVGSLGWKGTRNGKLLAAVEAAGFHVMITNDKNPSAQQKLFDPSVRRAYSIGYELAGDPSSCRGDRAGGR